MSFFGTRRSRQARIFRPSPTLPDRLKSACRDYRVLMQVLTAGLAVLIMLLAGASWRSGFAFRAGQFIPGGVQARVAFEVENILETRRQRMEAEEASPLVLIQDATVIDRLQSQLRDQLSDIANSESLADVPARTLEAFGLDTADAESRSATFVQLKSVLEAQSKSAGSRIDEVLLEYAELMEAAKILGLLDGGAADRMRPRQSPSGRTTDLRRTRPIRIVSPEGDALHYGVLSDVLLQEQLRETGRLGKTWPRLEILKTIRGPIETWLHRNLKNQLRLDEKTTDDERRLAGENSPAKLDSYPRGTVLVPGGSQLGGDEEQMALLWREYEEYEQQITPLQRLTRLGATLMLLTLLVILFGAFLRFASPGLLRDTPQLLGFIAMCGIALFLSCSASRDHWRAEIVPLMAAVMITAIAHSQVVAILTAFCLSLLVSMATLGELGHFVSLVTISVTAIIPLRRIKSRMTMIKSGFLLALVAFYTVWGMGVLQAYGSDLAWQNTPVLMTALKFAGWALVCNYLVAGSLPFIESAFGIVTDISLLELTAVSHPLLQELARRAPGTYNHSMTVATLAEAAAEAIGANGLLTRVGAYFHDIGKMMKPEYFIENMTEGSANHHQSLAPAMSTLVIIGHVREGLELAEENNLPGSLIRFIEQHHGTTLVEYFFHEAARKADVDHRTDADESSFRYPGPKPQSRETAVLMIADAVESASRTLKEPTPRRIQSLVHEITMKRLLDGQFDECDLKMTEIRLVEESLVKSLLAAHHGRVKYPGQRTA